jgi:hypothetical protein
VVPLFKSGNRRDVGNYRPISLLSVFNKIFGLNQNLGVAGVFLDLSKAFDSLNHDILFDKLFMCGIRGPALDLMRSYLKDRYQYVSICGESSSLAPVSNGVPQGSVLGPLLYLIYVNDIGRLPLSGKLNLWADDTAYFVAVRDKEQLLHRIRVDLELIIDFFRVNKLCVNVSKSSIMIFGSKPADFATRNSFFIMSEYIRVVDEFKYLGVIFDSKLTWGSQVRAVCGKVSKYVGILRKLSFSVPIGLLKILYFSMVHSHFTYCIEVWGTAVKSVLQPLQVLQNRAIKSVFKLPILTNSIDLYFDKQILCICSIYYLQLGVMIKKVMNGLCISNLDFERKRGIYDTRQS